MDDSQRRTDAFLCLLLLPWLLGGVLEAVLIR